MLCAGCGIQLRSAERALVSYCRNCALAYRGSAARMAMDLRTLAQALKIDIPAEPLDNEPGSKPFDFFISFSHTNVTIATRINSLLKRSGYQTVFLPSSDSAGANFLGSMMNGLQKARRIILLLSPHFLEADSTASEWLPLLSLDPVGRNRLIVLLKVADCDVPMLPQPFHITDLVGFSGRQLDEEILGAIRRVTDGAHGQTLDLEISDPDEQAEPLPAPKPETRRDGSAMRALAAVATLLALMALIPAIPRVFDTDFSLPFRWILYDGNLHEKFSVVGDPLPLRHWRGTGVSTPLARSGKQWLDLRGMALLNSTTSAGDGIAQYTVAFERAGVNMVSRTSSDNLSYYLTRLEYSKPGELAVRIRFQGPKGSVPIPHSKSASVFVGNRTRHEVAVSMNGDLHTVWLNGTSITTFKDSRLGSGAVGMMPWSGDKVRLFGWSINLKVHSNESSQDARMLPGEAPYLFASAPVR